MLVFPVIMDIEIVLLILINKHKEKFISLIPILYIIYTIYNHDYPHLIFINVYLNLLIDPPQNYPPLNLFYVENALAGLFLGP